MGPTDISGQHADLYLRLSDARNEEALDGREARLRAKAADLGWGVHRVIVENDLTPRNGNGNGLRPASAFKRRRIVTPSGRAELRTVRPGFRSMLDDLMTGQATAVLAEDLDRLLRQPRDGEDLLDAVEHAGATCLSLSGTLKLTEGGTNDERFMARILANVANKASADTGRRVSAARDRLAGQSWQGGRRPYGYKPKPGTEKYHRTLVVVPAEKAVIQAAARDILDLGISLKAIARDLRERNVPTVTGTAWSAETLKDVLIKPAVAGLAVRKGKIVGPAPWSASAILNRDVWERLADKLNDPSRRTNAARGNEPRWLLSGFARCGVCQGRVRVIGGKDHTPGYTGAACAHFRRKAADLDEYIAWHVIDRLSRPDAAGLLRPPPRPGIDVGKLRKEARRLRSVRKAKNRMHTDGLIDDAELAAELRAIKDKLTGIEMQLAVSDQADPLPEFRAGRPAEAVWNGLSLPRRRAVVQALISSIVINRTPNRGRRYDIADTVEVTPHPQVISGV
jgi:DNA invertase Pin-like site-specific DNA recombinase